MKEANISIVIPCYNAEKYLYDALVSIREQTASNLIKEIILVDDGSTDDSKFLYDTFDIHIEKVYLRNGINKGIGYTRDRGLNYASGEYVAFLSSDDCYDKYFINEAVNELTSPKNAVYTDYYRCNENLEPISIYRSQWFSKESVIDYALMKNMYINFSSVIVPKDIAIKIRFLHKLRHGEDLIFLLDSLDKINWFRIPKPLLYYRIHSKQGTRLKDDQEFDLLWVHIIKRLEKLGIDKRLIIENYRSSWSKRHSRGFKRYIK